MTATSASQSSAAQTAVEESDTPVDATAEVGQPETSAEPSAEHAEQGPSDSAPTPGRLRTRSVWWTRLAAGAVVTSTIAAAGYATWGAHRAQQLEDSREEALSAAKTRLPALLSYQSSRLDDDLTRAIEQTTGSFRDDYSTVLTDVVAPTAKERGISTQAEVTAAGVLTATDDNVTVLVFLTQTTTTQGQPPTVSGSRVEVSMKPDGADWKIAGLQPK